MGCGSPDRVNLVSFEEAQELGLDVEAHVGDLVEEEGATGGGADHAGEGGIGAREGPLAVAEELAVEHFARHGGAVEGQEDAVGAVGGAVNGVREHLLAGAGLAGEEDGERGRGDAAGDGQELGGLLGGPDDAGVGVERLGGPEGGALLFVAAVAIERQRGGDEFSNGDEGAALVEVGLWVDGERPGLVVVVAEGDGFDAVPAERGERLVGFQPRVSRTRGPRGPAAIERRGPGTSRAIHHRERLRPQHVGVRPSSRRATAFPERRGRGGDSSNYRGLLQS